MGVAYRFHATVYSMFIIKKSKKLSSQQYNQCVGYHAITNLLRQLPHNFFGIEDFSFKNACLKCIREQLRGALNGKGRLGKHIGRLTKYIIAKHGGSTNLTNISIGPCLHFLAIRTIALLNKDEAIIKRFHITFSTKNTLLKSK